MERFIGQIIDYDPQPYGPRKVRITAVTQTGTRKVCRRDPDTGAYSFPEVPSYRVDGIVTEGREVSRLFQYTTSRDITGRRASIYGVTEAELATGRVITALCG